MRFVRTVLTVLGSLLVIHTALLAHHALQTQFDMSRTVTLNGEIAKVEWSNPHVRLFLHVPGQNKTVTWELYMASPNQQMLNGWTIDSYRRGDHVSIQVYPARDGSRVGYAKLVKFSRTQ